jgi:hypothetical protein
MARAPLRVRDEKKGIKAYGPGGGVCVCSLAARRFCVSLCASASNWSVHAKMGHGMALAKSMRAGAAFCLYLVKIVQTLTNYAQNVRLVKYNKTV